MKILFVQKFPCIRNWKMARALKAKGFNVDLAYTISPASRIYSGLSDDVYACCIKVRSARELKELASSYDIVHSHNEPDDLTVILLSVGVPVIHDSHDMISLRPGRNRQEQQKVDLLEAAAHRGAAGRVYVSDYMLKVAAERYNVDPQKSVVFGNYVDKCDIPAVFPPRIKEEGIHLVYQGGLGIRGTHRDFSSIFSCLTAAGIHLHVYPAAHTAQFAGNLQKSPFLHLHESKPPSEIITEIAKYDFGIIPFEITPQNRTFLNQSMPNKLYEYLAAGLPVIAPRLFSLEKFISSTGSGIIYDHPSEIPARLEELTTIRNTVNVRQFARTYQEEIMRLIDFYYLIESCKGRRK
ncbi:MAG: glycosyltransferase [Bacillota bacterium]|nr:glycosyltransferase [Bacillota bacterium]